MSKFLNIRPSSGVSYSYDIPESKENFERIINACFAKLTYISAISGSLLTHSVNIKIFLNRKQECLAEDPLGHCVLTIKELKQWLNELKYWIPFTYKISNSERFGKGVNELDINCNLNIKQIAVLLTCVRFSFEYPFNIFLKESILLYNKGYFEDLSIFEIYHIVQNCYEGYYNTNHCFNAFTRMPKISLDILKNNFNNYTGSVNSFLKRERLGGNIHFIYKTPLLNRKLDVSDEAIKERYDQAYSKTKDITWN